MMSTFLPALQTALAEALQGTLFEMPLFDAATGKATGQTASRAPQVYIGDLPRKRNLAHESQAFPFVLLRPVKGGCKGGEEVCDLAVIFGVMNASEDIGGDTAALEMDIGVLQSCILRAVRPFLHEPLQKRFQLVVDEKDFWAQWHSDPDASETRPYTQRTVMLRWKGIGLL